MLQKSICRGEWEKDRSAGGANTTRESYGANPQFKLFLPEVDTDAFMASCVISLMQFGTKEGDIAIGKIGGCWVVRNIKIIQYLRIFCVPLSNGCERKAQF